jgi:transketolase
MVDFSANPDFVFLTGDLGYNALEPLKAVAGERFINAGLAEQNMVSVAAGLARSGLRPWTYSIAPFIYARPFEQIRNDVCLHDLPVKLVGNGGGFGYGVMGGTHHALEDYGALLSLQHMLAFVPAFVSDVAPVVARMSAIQHPAYLRLGRCEKPAGYAPPPYAAWRKLTLGSSSTLVIIGPLAGPILTAVLEMESAPRPSLWILSELPIVQDSIPAEFLADLSASESLVVVEEHVAHGGAGQMLAHALLLLGLPPRKFIHHHATGYISGAYGSQQFHRLENRLDAASVLASLQKDSTSC